MTKKFALLPLAICLTGCAIQTNFNVSNKTISTMADNPVGTYSSYGRGVKYDAKDKLWHLTVYVGGLGYCESGAILYARPTLDEFMKANGFSSYNVVKGEYSFVPLSKCELFISYEK